MTARISCKVKKLPADIYIHPATACIAFSYLTHNISNQNIRYHIHDHGCHGDSAQDGQ